MTYIQSYKAGRVIIVVEARKKAKDPDSETYLAALLVREKNGKYGLPGGGYDSRKGDSNLETTIDREVKEELGLDLSSTEKRHAYRYQGRVVGHDIRVVGAAEACASNGKVTVNCQGNEVQHLGLYRIDDIDQVNQRLSTRQSTLKYDIPRESLENYVFLGLNQWVQDMHTKGITIRPTKGIEIDGQDYTQFYQHMKQGGGRYS